MRIQRSNTTAFTRQSSPPPPGYPPQQPLVINTGGDALHIGLGIVLGCLGIVALGLFVWVAGCAAFVAPFASAMDAASGGSLGDASKVTARMVGSEYQPASTFSVAKVVVKVDVTNAGTSPWSGTLSADVFEGQVRVETGSEYVADVPAGMTVRETVEVILDSSQRYTSVTTRVGGL